MSKFLLPKSVTSKAEKLVYLQPGHLFFAEEPTIVKTLLGSCVSTIFYSPRLKLGGISHAQLPARNSNGITCTENCPVKCMTDSRDENDFKYVTCSTNHLIESFTKRGVKVSELEVKIFGGANVLPTDKDTDTVGARNIQAANLIINEQKIPVKAKKLGGTVGMSIVFYSDTGEVFVRDHRATSIRGETNQIG